MALASQISILQPTGGAMDRGQNAAAPLLFDFPPSGATLRFLLFKPFGFPTAQNAGTQHSPASLPSTSQPQRSGLHKRSFLRAIARQQLHPGNLDFPPDLLASANAPISF
jgi:hypothetical protein